MLKQKKGITLVALVITIIVLLILAGVSISMVVGDNGVLTRAKNAASETAKAQANEALQTAVIGVQGDYATNWSDDSSFNLISKMTTDELQANVSSEYTITITKASTDAATAAEGTIAKSGGATYSFKLKQVEKGYGVTIEGFAVKSGS